MLQTKSSCRKHKASMNWSPIQLALTRATTQAETPVLGRSSNDGETPFPLPSSYHLLLSCCRAWVPWVAAAAVSRRSRTSNWPAHHTHISCNYKLLLLLLRDSDQKETATAKMKETSLTLQQAMLSHPHTICPFATSVARGAPPPSLLCTIHSS